MEGSFKQSIPAIWPGYFVYGYYRQARPAELLA